MIDILERLDEADTKSANSADVWGSPHQPLYFEAAREIRYLRGRLQSIAKITKPKHRMLDELKRDVAAAHELAGGGSPERIQGKEENHEPS